MPRRRPGPPASPQDPSGDPAPDGPPTDRPATDGLATDGQTVDAPSGERLPLARTSEAHPPAGIRLGVEGEHTLLAGAHAGDRSVRIIRPRLTGMRASRPGYLTVEQEHQPTGTLARTVRRLRRVLIGRPIRSELEHQERLSKPMGLAAFGTDNISSSAYASEELMRVLLAAGTVALALTLPLTLAVVVLLAVVVTSYQQTIRAYPKGGGSYIVASDNLGVIPGLVAGSSILVDYVLTVAVSVSAGVAALTSIFPGLYGERVLIAIGAIAVIAWANLRGVRESGALFVAPVYAYLVCMLGVIGYGLFRFAVGDAPVYVPPPDDPAHGAAHGVEALGLLLVLRAFASGAVGLTGTEAIADGVAAFKAPESRNARITLITMAICFASLFLGISFLASWLHIIPDPREVETVNSQLTRTLVGSGPLHFVVQVVTAVLLVLAANTAFADFPRLASFMARDKFLPSYFSFRGDRLAFSNGIVVLAAVAALLVLLFQGSVTSLIPLYTVGVFLAFTLSQAGLVMRWWRLREPGWRGRLAVNAAGAATTAVVAVVVGVTKFALGAWVVLVLIPGLVALLLGVRRHYRLVADELVVTGDEASSAPDLDPARLHHTVLIPVGDVNRATLRAVAYARSLTGQIDQPAPAGGRARVVGVHVTDDRVAGEQLRERWARAGAGIPLVVLQSPYRSLVGPLVTYIDALARQRPDGTAIVTVLLPEFVPAHWWEHLLHMQTALRLKGSLLFRPGTAVTSVPYHLRAQPVRSQDRNGTPVAAATR